MSAPIRVRLTGWYVLVLAVVLSGLGVFVVTQLRSYLTAARDRSLREGAVQIAQGYQVEGPPEFHDKAVTVLPGPLSHGSGAQILDPSGPVVLSVGDPVTETPIIGPHALRGVAGGRMEVLDAQRGTPPQHLRVFAMPVTRHGRHQILVVVTSVASIDRAVDRVLVLLVLGGGGALALVALGGWWIARKALRPVERMTTRADRIGITEIRDQRIAVPRVKDELAHLATTLNAMLDRLEEGVRARERLIADASHELRVPLAAMRSELDVSLRHDELPDQARAVAASARDEVVRMSSIVENLLTLARADEGRLELLVAPSDLRDVVAAAMRTHRHAAAAAGVGFKVAGDAGTIEGDRDRLQQVVSNLLDNAIRHAPSGSTVTVTLWRSETEAGVTVSDDGPGVPDSERERIFERFARRDRARSHTSGAGSGLGLAISREIVRAHGGRIWVDARPRSGGTFTVALPLAPPVPGPAEPSHAAAVGGPDRRRALGLS